MNLPESDQPQERLRRNGQILALLLAEASERIVRILLARIEHAGSVDQEARRDALHHAAHAIAGAERQAGRRDDLLDEQLEGLHMMMRGS